MQGDAWELIANIKFSDHLGVKLSLLFCGDNYDKCQQKISIYRLYIIA